MIGYTISYMLQNGYDPLTSTAVLPYFNISVPFLPYLLNASETFSGSSGQFTFNRLLSRDGEMAMFNWRTQNGSQSLWTNLGTFSRGSFAWNSGTTRTNIRWTSSTVKPSTTNTWVQPLQEESRMLRVGIMFRKAGYPRQATEWLAATKWIVDYANRNVLSYYQLSFDHVDLGTDSASSVRSLRQWMDANDPVALLGPITTAIAIALSPLAQDADVPLISPNAPGETLSNSFYYRGFLRVSDSDGNWGRALWSFMRKMRWTSFAAISSNDEDRVVDQLQFSLPSGFKMTAQASFEYYSPTYAAWPGSPRLTNSLICCSYPL